SGRSASNRSHCARIENLRLKNFCHRPAFVAKAASGDAGVMEAEAEEAEEETDMYDVIEPVDLLSKLPKDFYERLASQRSFPGAYAARRAHAACATYAGKLSRPAAVWSAGFAKVEGSQRSAGGGADGCEGAQTSGRELRGACLGACKVQISGLYAADKSFRRSETCAKRADFARTLFCLFCRFCAQVVTPLLEKCKEKKQTALDALRGALDATFFSKAEQRVNRVTIRSTKLNSLSDIIEDVTTTMNHKNPNVKAESVRWLVRCLKITKQLPPKPEVKVLNEMLLKSTDDSFVEVRESAFEGLGTLMKLVGERIMQPYLEKLDNIKSAKVKEVYEKAVVCYRPPAAVRKPAANPPASRTAKVRQRTSISDAKSKENNPPVSAPSDAPAATRPGTRQTGLRKKAPVASVTNRPEADGSNPKPGAAGEPAAPAAPASPPAARSFAARGSSGALSRMSSAGSLAGRLNAKKKSMNTVGSSPAISGGDALAVAADDTPGGKMPVLTSDTKAKESRSAHDKGM
ncbi:MAG: hypothetical protein BJ554DRAFT_3759, partial [Olpidium bornovanus]